MIITKESNVIKNPEGVACIHFPMKVTKGRLPRCGGICIFSSVTRAKARAYSSFTPSEKEICVVFLQGTSS